MTTLPTETPEMTGTRPEVTEATAGVLHDLDTLEHLLGQRRGATIRVEAYEELDPFCEAVAGGHHVLVRTEALEKLSGAELLAPGATSASLEVTRNGIEELRALLSARD